MYIRMISEAHLTLKTRVMMLKNSLDHSNKVHFNIYIYIKKKKK